MIYPTILAHEQYSQAGLNQMSLQTGTVIAHQPGTNMLQVRLPGAGDRVIERVLAPYDSTFQSGDRVLIVKSPAEAWWMAVCRLQNPDQYGLYSSSAMQENVLHTPSSFTVFATAQLLIGQWDAWSGQALCYEVQYDSTADEMSVNFLHTFGSYFIYNPPTPGTYYARVRAMRYDVALDEAFYGSWSSWGSATTEEIVTRADYDALESMFLAHVQEQEWAWALHVTGAM